MPCQVDNSSFNSDTVLNYTSCRQYNCWDNPFNLMSLETRKSSSEIVQCVLMPSVFLVGAPANIVSMIVFYRQGLRDRMNLCLFSLAFVDLMYVTALFINVSFCWIRLFVPDENEFIRITLVQRATYFVAVFGYYSGFLTMIVAVERCVCVLFPLKATGLISTKRMAAVITLSVSAMHALCGVYIVKEAAVSVKNEASGKYKYVLSTTNLFLSHSILKVIENIVLPFICFSSFSVVILTTALTVVGLRSASVWRKSTASGSGCLKGQGVLVRMLVVVSCVYIICTSPAVALALIRFTVPEFRADGSYCNIYITTHLIDHLIVMVNSSINFLVYFIMSSRFRHELKSVLRKMLPA